MISICPEALIYARRDTLHPTMIFFAASARTAISSPAGSERNVTTQDMQGEVDRRPRKGCAAVGGAPAPVETRVVVWAE